jgi:hypothetical protein
VSGDLNGSQCKAMGGRGLTQVRLADFGHGTAEWAITESTGRTPHD